MSNEPVILTRDVEAAIVPIGSKITLQKGELAQLTQSLGGSYTVVVNGNMFRIDGKNADALGFERVVSPAGSGASQPATPEQLQKLAAIQQRMRDQQGTQQAPAQNPPPQNSAPPPQQ